MVAHVPSLIPSCRVCHREALVDVLDLGNVAVSDFAVDEAVPLYSPLTLAVCDPADNGCGFVQLRYQGVDPELLYRHYWYKSGVNESVRQALSDVVRSVEEVVALGDGDAVVDIGANDGTLFTFYSRRNLTKVAFEPARNQIDECRLQADIVINEFFSTQSVEQWLGDDFRARVITAIGMFYDVDDPHAFLDVVERILAPDGVFVMEMAYLPEMIRTNGFDNICHEHVGYYSLTSLATLVAFSGLAIRDVEFNAVNGGSFRIYLQNRLYSQDAAWPRPDAPARIRRVLDAEHLARLSSPGTYVSFAGRIDTIGRRLKSFLSDVAASGKVVHAYGASTKGNTILQHFGIDGRLISAMVARTPSKWGKRTIGTSILIISDDDSRAARPDYYLVLPWHLRASFVAREHEYLERGGAMIFPLPTPMLVRAEGGRIVEGMLP